MTRLLVLAVLLTACAGASPSPTTHDLTGTFTLTQDSPPPMSDNETYCEGTGGYTDIQAGLDVVVRDQGGDIIGTGALEYEPPAENQSLRVCVFTFTVEDVPAASFYEIEVGDRGSLSYSAAELDVLDWSVAFTLGD